MKTKMFNVGLNHHRFKDNPEEKRIAEAWDKHDTEGNTLAHLLDTQHHGSPPTVPVETRKVVATVIQWLGSPVG